VIDVGVLVDKINQMSSFEIAEMLKAQGVQGVPSVEESCVLARWIHKESGVFVRVGIHEKTESGSRFGIVPQDADLDTGSFSEFYAVETGVQAFIGEFDNGCYPELVVPYEEYE